MTCHYHDGVDRPECGRELEYKLTIDDGHRYLQGDVKTKEALVCFVAAETYFVNMTKGDKVLFEKVA